MANLDFFKKMKRQSYFINTSRGAVCIENDLVQALKEKLIIGAALDVFQKEPVEKNNPLLQCEPVILTPHTAGQTVESQRRMSLDAAKQIRNYFENGVVVHAVT
jgi:phosphoglycerate dehydrogenase-like enzyme